MMYFILAMTSVANGIGELKSQLVGYTSAAVLKIPLCILLCYMVHNWIIVIIANIVLLAPYTVVQFFVLRKILRSREIEMQHLADACGHSG
jgi:hypothetical protein